MEFKDRIRQIRGKLSQSDFAAQIGVHYTTVQAYENGKLPKGEILQKICDRFGITGDWLLFGIGPTYRLGVEIETDAFDSKISPAEAMPEVGVNDISGLVAQAIDVLQSRTVYSQALAQNISAFHRAVNHEVKLKNQVRSGDAERQEPGKVA